jgi:hypothetical protein
MSKRGTGTNLTLDIVNACSIENPPFIMNTSGKWTATSSVAGKGGSYIDCATVRNQPSAKTAMSLQNSYRDLKKTFDTASNSVLNGSKIDLLPAPPAAPAKGAPSPARGAPSPARGAPSPGRR